MTRRVRPLPDDATYLDTLQTCVACKRPRSFDPRHGWCHACHHRDERWSAENMVADANRRRRVRAAGWAYSDAIRRAKADESSREVVAALAAFRTAGATDDDVARMRRVALAIHDPIRTQERT